VEKIRAAATMVSDGDGRWMLLERICVYFFFYSGVPSQGVVCNCTVLIKFNPFLKKKERDMNKFVIEFCMKQSSEVGTIIFPSSSPSPDCTFMASPRLP
jgi:hypothetical protein